MEILIVLVIIILSYLIGSIPFGYLIVRWRTGLDIREIQSGRTGGTNAMRAAGLRIGLLTAMLDILKGAITVWIAQLALPASPWAHIAAPILAILGHNYSLFMVRRDESRSLRFSGGAGGAPCVGGSLGLWPTSLIVIVPLAAGIFFGVGYASVTTLSVGLLSSIVFTYRALVGQSPWIYALYGIAAEMLLIWALIPNIRRLLKGDERLHGWRAKRMDTQTTGSN